MLLWRHICYIFIILWLSTVNAIDGDERNLRSSSLVQTLRGPDKTVVLAAGNFTVDGKSANIAKYVNGRWSFISEMDLHTFAGEGSGVIRDMTSFQDQGDLKDKFDLFVVGEFDITTKSSQISYCSIGDWDGYDGLSKVGEGLCPRGGDPAAPVQMYATTVAGNSTDKILFVGGNFASRVWDGRRFLDVFNIAMYNLETNSWRPLTGFLLLDDQMTTNDAVVTAMSYEINKKILYVGGHFNIESYIPYPEGRVDRAFSHGLAVWTQERGLMPFEGGSVEKLQPIEDTSSEKLNTGDQKKQESRKDFLVSHVSFDEASHSLLVTGQFDTVGGQPCNMVAMWSFLSRTWHCLIYDFDGFSRISAAYKDPSTQTLYVAGRVNSSSASSKLLLPGKKWSVASLDLNYFVAAAAEERKHGGLDWDEHLSEVGVAGVRGRKLEHRGAEDRRSHDDVDGAHRSRISSRNENYSSKHEMKPPKWKWLQNFGGSDGPIESLILGRGELEGVLVLAGQFDADNSVMFWPMHIADNHDTYYDDKSSGDRDGREVTEKGIRGALLGCNQTLNGTVMSILQVTIPADKGSHKELHHRHGEGSDDVIIVNRNNISALVILGLLFGGLMGICCAYYYFRVSFPYEHLGEDDHELNSGDFGMSLKTLSGRKTGREGFRNIFVHAMKARHLPTHESLLLIDPKEIVLSRIIGEGSFGRVWSGTHHNNKVAVKEFVFAQAAVAGESMQRTRIIEEIVGEAGIMGCLRHPKILQIYGCSLTMQAIWITSELCAMGSLRKLLNNEQVMSQITFLQELSLCLDIADGCHYLHTRTPPIIHRDLKSHNIFIQESSPGTYVAKIGDWGSARAVALADSKSKNMTRGIGTACWLAPEVINSGHSSMGSDVYSYGIILWEVMTRREVYAGLTAEQIIAKVANNDLRPALTPNLPLRDVMVWCWKQNAGARPSFSQIVRSLSRSYKTVKGNVGMRGKRMSSRSSLNVVKVIDSDEGSSVERALVMDETPIRMSLARSEAYGSTSTSDGDGDGASEGDMVMKGILSEEGGASLAELEQVAQMGPAESLNQGGMQSTEDKSKGKHDTG